MPSLRRQAPPTTPAQGRVDGSRGLAAATELPSLTSLRGLAAAAVVLFHASYFAANYGGAAPPGLWQRGYLAVDLFFFLSGFVLTHVYHGRLEGQRRWPAVGRFLWARFCRIYPACLFTTGVLAFKYALGTLFLPPDVSFKTQLTAALLLMQVPWLDSVALNGPSWSISAECYAYLLFPFAVPVIYRLRDSTAAAIFGALLLAIAIDHPFIAGEETRTCGWGALLRALPEFMSGVIAYRAYASGRWRGIWQKDLVFAGVVAAIVVSLLFDMPDGAVVLLLPALLLASVANTGRAAGLLGARPLRWLGEISYSVYIFQNVAFSLLTAACAWLVAHGLDGSRLAAVAVLFVIASGALVHRCIDVPLRAALRAGFRTS
ncbi:MAG TPA: acyltransferase [Stellaceae bacterium]|nr:acyltransferase [Stellaceae bacterium]